MIYLRRGRVYGLCVLKSNDVFDGEWRQLVAIRTLPPNRYLPQTVLFDSNGIWLTSQNSTKLYATSVKASFAAGPRSRSSILVDEMCGMTTSCEVAGWPD